MKITVCNQSCDFEIFQNNLQKRLPVKSVKEVKLFKLLLHLILLFSMFTVVYTHTCCIQTITQQRN